jgi:hypothetical protein
MSLPERPFNSPCPSAGLQKAAKTLHACLVIVQGDVVTSGIHGAHASGAAGAAEDIGDVAVTETNRSSVPVLRC